MADKNKHQYIGWTESDKTPRQIIGGPMTGWMYSDTLRQVSCPDCGSDPGWHCQSAAGRKTYPPHSARLGVMVKKIGIEAFQGKPAVTPASTDHN